VIEDIVAASDQVEFELIICALNCELFNDGATVGDTLTASRLVVLSDGVTTGDNISKTVSYVIEDSVVTEDSIDTTVSKTLTDSAVTSDSINITYGRTLSDSIVTSDEISKIVNLVIEDNVVTSEDFGISQGIILSDSVVTSDIIGTGVGRTLTDSAVTSDSISITQGRTLSDSATASDEISKTVSYVIEDNVVTSDIVGTTQGRTLTDGVVTSDSIITILGRTLSDSAIVSDEISKTVSYVIEDSAVVSEIFGLTQGITLTDSVVTSDVISPIKIFGVTVVDTASADDTVSYVVTKSLSDIISTDDVTSYAVTKSLSDIARISDDALASRFITLLDSAITTENVDTNAIIIPPPPPPPPPSPGPGPSAGSSGATGGSPGGGGVVSTGTKDGTDLPTRINSVRYSVCNETIVRIITSGGELPPDVYIRGVNTGAVTATLALYQPYAEHNELADVDKYLYEVVINPSETYFIVAADGIVDKDLVDIQIEGCEGNVIFVREDPRTLPQIFDYKFSIGENGTTVRADADEYYYVAEPEEVTVTAIIDNPIHPLRRAELRVMHPGDAEFTALRMNIESLVPVSITSSKVSVTIPVGMITDPLTEFWIHAINSKGKVSDSESIRIGVQPERYLSQPIDAKLQAATKQIVAEGRSLSPTVSVYLDEDEPLYGLVSIVADGVIVSKRPHLLQPGENELRLLWSVPKLDSATSYDLQGRVDIYDDDTYVTSSVRVDTYVRTQITPINENGTTFEMVTNMEGDVIARPALIYASDSTFDENLRFRVTASDGTCIIGGTSDCKVSESTAYNRGGLTTVDIDGQVLRVKYSGDQSTLERFSITSFDPILGNWKVELESADGDEVLMKIQYRGEKSPVVTVSSE